MKEVTLTLPDAVTAHLQDDCEFQGHANPSEYASILLEEHFAREKAALTELLLEGLESGEAVEATPEFWAELRAETDALVREHTRGSNKATAA